MNTKKYFLLPKLIVAIFSMLVLTGCDYGKKIEDLQEKTKALEKKVNKLETQYHKMKSVYTDRQKANSEKVQDMLR
ncbi:hypothetical protein [Chromohalobacter sp. 11-W]|uniref:hypothetical protein n=1 Tax=Chromohalobacter sp. 11-W TaxID=2994061 RepID=UPI002468E4C0|nr:hypothetical protein [Chromohalobacter sp. 11-W]